MRLSLWRQFSSNHSSNFTIVGEFQSPELAQQAASQLRQAAKAISDWYDANPEIQQSIVEGFMENPTLAELQICQQYDLTCDRAIDWLANCGYADDCVAIYGNYVFLQNLVNGGRCENDAGEALFDQLMAKLGGRVTVDEENTTAVLTTITCVAPNDSIAQAITQNARQYLQRDQETLISVSIPWLAYHSGERDSQADHLIQLDKRFVARENAERLRNDLREFLELSAEDRRRVRNGRSATESRCVRWQADSGVHVDGRVITLGKVHLGRISTALPAIVAWLKDQGCTQIQYKVEQF